MLKSIANFNLMFSFQPSSFTSAFSIRHSALKSAAAAGRKPNSVRLRLGCPCGLRRATIIPLAPSSLTGSSGLPGGFGRAVLITPPYLALLRAGFCLPPVLPRARCALTAPFHPYPPFGGRYIFCATILQVTLTGRYPAHCPAEFGLSSRLRALRALRRSRLAELSPSVIAGLPRRSVRRTRRRAIIWPTAAASS